MRSNFKLLSVLVLGLFLLVAATVTAERTGGWLDEVIISEEVRPEAALTRMQAGELHVYAYTVSDPEIYEAILADPSIEFEMSYGSYNELTFNPAGPIFPGTGKLNPFAVKEIREAMNWLIDRDYIVREIYGGMSVPKVTTLNSAFPDYARHIEVTRRLEAEYAHDPRRAEQVISEKMRELGAEKRAGVWNYNGEPVEIIILIRTEDERVEMGDYVADLLEGIGFKTRRDYRTSAEASPIWYSGDPADGRYHIYTGGWITTVVSRDDADNFAYFYTSEGLPSPLWMAYDPDPEFFEVAQRLDGGDFRTMEERAELFEKALVMSMKDSVRLWLVDNISVSPRLANVSVAADLAGAIAGSYMWAHTLRWDGQEGGSMNVAMPSILTEPWNALGGGNWIYDMMLIRGTSDFPALPDPFTGLYYPQRLKAAEVTIVEGQPVSKTLDWVDLKFEPEIVVPRDAYIDWDPVEQRFITVEEKYPDEDVTAVRKVVVHFEDDLFDRKMHDGSTFDMADLIFKIIVTFDRASEESIYYDPASVPAYESFVRTFRGFRIVQEDPAVLEYYSTLVYLDAEQNAYQGAYALWPYYTLGSGPWHQLAIGLLAEVAEEAAFTPAKADDLGVDRINYVAGPTVEIMARHIDKAIEDGFIPYEPTLGQFLSTEDAVTKYQNLKNWYNDKGHLWVSFGPYYMERAFPVEKMVQLKRFEDYPDPSDKWEIFGAPAIADVDISGPRRVPRGSEATFDVEVTLHGAPYPVESIMDVVYLVFDPRGNLLFTGDAEAIEDGLWRLKLSTEDTMKLLVGVNKLEVAVTSVLTAIPSFDSTEFVAH